MSHYILDENKEVLMSESRSYAGANFKLKNSGKYALVKCPECHCENYALNVLSGICTWCRFDINGVKDG